mgnify:CR=1 FL=1
MPSREAMSMAWLMAWLMRVANAHGFRAGLGMGLVLRGTLLQEDQGFDGTMREGALNVI